MSRMIQLIRASAVPWNTMNTAARGALAVPPAEMIEILVHLARHNKVFGQTASITLAGWDEAACRAVAADPQTPKEVLDYFVDPSNLRPTLLPALLENPSVSQAALAHIAESARCELLDTFLQSPRAKQLPAIMSALNSNPHLEGRRAAALKAASSEAADAAPAAESAEEGNPVPDEAVHAFMTEHAAEIAATPEKPFQPVAGIEGLPVPAGSESAPAPPVPVTTSGSAAAAAAPAKSPIRHGTKHVTPAPAENRESAMQKIKRLDIKGRIQLALKGNKEERSLLIRDGTKIVALAVLDSPKITDAEVEKFATQKNVLEAVLRTIPLKRRFAKQYPIQRNLVANPRTPIDVSLALIKHMLINDLKNLCANKEVSETVRKLALRMVKQKTESEAQKHRS
jgi:hypothetical protein